MNRWCSDQGRFGRLAALIMEKQLAVFIVTVEGGLGSMDGRWCMRHRTSCQLDLDSRQSELLHVKSDDSVVCLHRRRNIHSKISTQHMSSSSWGVSSGLVKKSAQAVDGERAEDRGIHKLKTEGRMHRWRQKGGIPCRSLFDVKPYWLAYIASIKTANTPRVHQFWSYQWVTSLSGVCRCQTR